jgi:hypothetical protein
MKSPDDDGGPLTPVGNTKATAVSTSSSNSQQFRRLTNRKPNDNKRGTITITSEKTHNEISEDQQRVLRNRLDNNIHNISMDTEHLQYAKPNTGDTTCNIIELNGDGRLNSNGPGIYIAQMRHKKRPHNVYSGYRT